jgi:hypothetical protein
VIAGTKLDKAGQMGVRDIGRRDAVLHRTEQNITVALTTLKSVRCKVGPGVFSALLHLTAAQHYSTLANLSGVVGKRPRRGRQSHDGWGQGTLAIALMVMIISRGHSAGTRYHMS